MVFAAYIWLHRWNPWWIRQAASSQAADGEAAQLLAERTQLQQQLRKTRDRAAVPKMEMSMEKLGFHMDITTTHTHWWYIYIYYVIYNV